MDTSNALNRQLLDQYGPLMNGMNLYRALGFRTYGAFRLANEQKKIPVQVYRLSGRRGWFARTNDVSAWLRSLGIDDAADRFKSNSSEGEN